MYFTNWIIIYRYRYTLSRLCLTELWKAAHQTTYSTKQRRVWNFPTHNPIRHILRNTDQHPSTHHRGHRSRGLAPTRVLTRLFFFYSLFSIAVNRCKFISFLVSLIPLCIFYRSVRIQLHAWTTVAHHCIFSHPFRSRQCRTTSRFAQLNNFA